MSDRYEAYESTRGGYGYVDLRDEEGGTTVLGADGEGRFSLPQAEAVAELLNEFIPAPGMARIDVSEDQARLLLSLLRAGRAHDTLSDQGVDISPEDIESLVKSLEGAVEAAGLEDESAPAP